MNLRDLQYLVAVAELQHVGKAAEACFVSQPALSMQLQKLEQLLGVQLFERSNKTLKITSVGEAIVEQAKQVLRGAEEIKEIAKAHQDPFAGDFRLGGFPTLAPYYLPQIVPLIHEALPKLNLLLVEEKTHTLLEMLKKGKLDAALIALPVLDEELITWVLFEDPFLLAVPKNHPLAGRESIDSRDMQQERLLLLEEGHCLRSQALSVCEHFGNQEYKEFRATSLETLRQMVIAGVGITLMPQLAAREDSHLAYIPFNGQPPSRTIGLVFRKNAARRACVERVYEIVQGKRE